MEKIAFLSGGVKCAGDLYLPPDLRPGEQRAGLVVGHGFGVVKQSLVEVGKFFSRAGYVALAIDYRTFGDSEGKPRGQLFPLNQVEDFRNAISWLQTRDEIDPKQIGIWGTSFGGAVCIYVAAVDLRVKAVVAQVPVVNGRRWLQALHNSAAWDELLVRLQEDRDRRFRGEPGALIPPTQRAGPDGIVPMDPRTMVVFQEYIARTGQPLVTADPLITLESVEKVIEFFPENVIHLIGPRPLTIVTTGRRDVIHLLDQIQDAYKKANEPKRLVLLSFEAYDLYWDPGRSAALRAALDCFEQYIPLR
jgi:acetyl esterase/lipase